MKPGNHIIFDLETWNNRGEFVSITLKTQVFRIIKDPLKRHENKALVKYKGEEYGIPFSEIKKVIPTNEQFKLAI